MKSFFLKLPCASFLLCALFSGCVNIERSYPDKHYFVLGLSGGGKPSNQTGNGTLEVSDIRISPRYEGQSFVYRISDSGYESDFYNQFLIAPGTLITEEVRKGLAQSDIFAYVINSSSQLQPTHRLDGAVNALYGDFRNTNAPSAVLEVEFFLTKQTPAANEIVVAKRYAKSVSLSGRSPEALVKGWDAALEGILMSFIADLKSANLQQ